MKVRINKHFLRQMLAILLCVAMVFTHSSFTALAEEPEGGSEFTEPGGEEDAGNEDEVPGEEPGSDMEFGSDMEASTRSEDSNTEILQQPDPPAVTHDALLSSEDPDSGAKGGSYTLKVEIAWEDDLPPELIDTLGSVTVKVNDTEVISGLEANDESISVSSGSLVEIECYPDETKEAYLKKINCTFDPVEDLQDTDGITFEMPDRDVDAVVVFEAKKHDVTLTAPNGIYYYNRNDRVFLARTGSYVNVGVNVYDYDNYVLDGVEYSYVSDGITVTETAGEYGYLNNYYFYQFTMPPADVTVTPIVRELQYYSVTTVLPEDPAHGSISVSPESAMEGETVTVTVSPENGYMLDSLSVNGSADEITAQSDGTYTFTMPGESATVSAVFTSVWKSLQAELDNGGEWEYAEPENIYVIRLTADAIAGSDDRALEFNFTDHPVILDLCGHSIDRNLGSETSGGNVLTIKGGELILRDSEGGGTITGGYNLSDSGGGVIVNGGIFTMEAGSITGNRIKEFNGAGVNLNDGTFKLKGGSITGNYAYDAVGAGVYVNSGSFLVSGEPTVMGNFTGTLTAVGLSGQQSSNIYLNHGCLISVEGSLGKAADFGVGAWNMGRFTDESYLTYHANDDPLDFFTGDDGHSIYQDAEGYPCIESSDHTAGDEPVWAWTDDGYVTASMRCSNCGELLWEKVAQLGDPAFDKFGRAHFTAHVSVDGVDYSTDGLLLEPVSVAQVDPYIDENGRYVPGTQQHWELVWNGQTHYYVRDDLPDNPYLEVLLLSQLALSWFEFNSAGDEILRYTGPIELGSLNVIELPLYAPDSDTPLSSIGDGSYAFIETGSSSLSGTSWEITDRGSITRISSYTFRALQNLTLTLNAQGEDAIIELDNNAFYDCENTVLKCYHSSLLELGSHDDDTGKYTVEYLDEHTYYAKDAEFADDYSEAVLIIGCSNSYVPCQYEVRIEHASVTITPDPDNTDGMLATASVIYEGEEYSLTASVESCLIEVSYSNGTAMGHSSFRVPKARGKDYAKFTFASLELTDVIIPLGTSFTGWTGNGATYGPDDVITVTGDSASFIAEWESTWDAVREALLDETGVAVYLYNSIQAGVDDLPLYVPEGADSALILRGYDVDRNLGAAADDGYVIRTDGTLYINQDPNITNEEGEHHTGGVVKGGKNSGNGGGIYVGGTGVLNAESISVDGNTSGGNGGGIYLDDGASAELNAVTVNENTAASHGAGVFVNGTLNAAGTDFYRNIASSGNGGGIYIADGCFVTLNGCKVQYNRAPAGWGGGILVGGGYGIDSGSVPGGGTIEGEGQAKGLRSASLREISYNLTFISTSIEYNYAGMGAGGIFVENGTVQIGNGDRIINNEGPNETWDNCDVNNNASNQSPFELGNGITDLTMGIKMGLAGAAGGAAGGFFSGVAGWVSSMIGAAAAIGITITFGWFILDRSKSNGESSQAFPDCNHPKDKLLTYSQWEEDYYSHVKESTICTQCWTLQSNSELTPEQSVNETSQVTEYKVTLPDGTDQKRYVNPYTVVITPGITGLEHLAQTVRIPHGRHQTEVHVLPTEVPWEGIEGYQFVGWVPVNGSSTITSVDLGDGGHNDDDTETVVGKWKVSITYDSGALLPESVTIAGESPLQPNPSFVDVGTNHTLLPNTWKRGLILYDGDVTYSAYVFDGWDVYSGNFVDKMLTLRWVLETATGLPGMSAGETVPVTKPLKVEARWKSVWTIMGLALNTAGYFYLPADAFAVELDSGITVEAMEGGAETVLDLNGHMADASYVSLTTTPFTVEGKLKITDTSDNKGGVISGGKNPLGAGGGILVKGGASLTMEDGITIEDNYCYSPSESEYETWFDDNGGGVMVQGHFLMEGGSIKDNGTSNSGGGVYIDEGATFRMTGGEMKDNLARIHYKDPSTQGGGVYVNGTFEVSGKVVIQDNKLSHELETDPDDINNVYLPSGKLIKVVGALDPEASIGVSMEEPGVITSGLKGNAGSDAWGSADNFTSDDDDYIVIINADGEAELIEKPATITIKGVSGSFNDKIKLNYYFELPEEVLSDQGAYVTITQAVESGENSGSGTNNGSGTAGAGVGQNLKLYVKDLTADDYVEGKGYKFSISLAAKEAGDTITAKAYNGKGHPLFIRGNLRDNDYTETGVQYSLMEYFDWLQKEGTGNEKKVGLAAMDYCAAASIYFDYNAKDLEVSSAVTDMSKETMDELVDNYKATRSGSLPEGVGIKGISAMLESDNTLRLYYGFTGVDPDDLTFEIDGETADLGRRDDGMRYLALEAGVYANHLQDVHEYSVSDGTNTYTIEASVLTYARSCARKSDEKTSNLGKALYLYNRAAVAAFGE